MEPRIEDYLDPRAYLNAVLEWRKSANQSFSISKWADELQFNSRSFLRLILVGKRVFTESSVETFVAGLKLSSTEARYFRNLVRLSQAKTHQLKEKYFAEVTKARKNSFSPVKDKYRFLASHMIPRLFTLLCWEDIDHSPENLARILRVKPQDITDWLTDLERLNLITKTVSPTGLTKYKKTTVTFDVADDMGDLALQAFHRRSLSEALNAIDTDKEQRWMQALVLPLNEAEKHELKDLIRKFGDTILEKYRGKQNQPSAIYQLNLNLIQVSETVLRGTSKLAPAVNSTSERKGKTYEESEI